MDARAQGEGGMTAERDIAAADKLAVWELWECLHTIKAALAPGASLDMAEALDAKYREAALAARAEVARPPARLTLAMEIARHAEMEGKGAGRSSCRNEER